ncbi:MAG: hypothetical protein PUD16_03465 [bacterium]|nr:hypothetical protein [bacterium]
MARLRAQEKERSVAVVISRKQLVIHGIIPQIPVQVINAVAGKAFDGRAQADANHLAKPACIAFIEIAGEHFTHQKMPPLAICRYAIAIAGRIA